MAKPKDKKERPGLGAAERAAPKEGGKGREPRATAREPGQPSKPTAQEVEEAAGGAERARGGHRWAGVWQVPVLLVGVLLLGVGVWLSLPKKEGFNLERALREVGRLLEDQQLEAAQKRVAEAAGHLKDASREQRGRFHLLRGDAGYLELARAKVWSAGEGQKITAEYAAALEAGQSFDDAHVRRWAETLAGLGEDEAALAKLGQLSAAAAGQRHRVIRKMLERRAAVPKAGLAEELGPLMGRFVQELGSEPDAGQRRAEEVWVTALKGRLMVAGEEPQRAIDWLLQKLQMLGGGQGDEDLAALMVPLGQGYLAVGEFAEAERWLRRAEAKLQGDASHALRGEVLVGLGKIALASSGDARGALESFARAAEGFPGTECYVEALVGQADALARLGADPEAKDKFAEAVNYLRDQPVAQKEAGARLLAEVVQSHYERAFGDGQYQLALDYAAVLRPLYEPELPRQLIEELAVSYERLAQAKGKEAAAIEVGGEAGEKALTGLHLANQETSSYYEQAGDYYHRSSQMADGQGDGQGMGEALWQSAQCYDQAQRWEKAIARYGEYVQLRPQDPRRASAMRQLGLAYQASGQYGAAAGQFERLIGTGKNSPEAYDSLVPLAQCYVALGENEAAKRTLRGVLENHPAIRPDSLQYRAALIELGKLHYRLGQYEEAIGLLTQAVERYGHTDDARNASVRFWLADAYRQSLGRMSEGGVAAMSAAQVAAQRQERTARLEEAQKLYSQVITELEARPAPALSELERLYYRNAFFYRGDCAYDLGRFQQAIELYDTAARKWERDPASLVALVQIVNAYGELGMVQEAKAANRRAQDQQRRIPEEAFNDPNLPMSRRHWEQWLKWTEELNLFDSGGATSSPAQQVAAPTP